MVDSGDTVLPGSKLFATNKESLSVHTKLTGLSSDELERNPNTLNNVFVLFNYLSLNFIIHPHNLER